MATRANLTDIVRCAVAAILLGSAWIVTIATLAFIFPHWDHAGEALALIGASLAVAGILSVYAWFALSMLCGTKDSISTTETSGDAAGEKHVTTQSSGQVCVTVISHDSRR